MNRKIQLCTALYCSILQKNSLFIIVIIIIIIFNSLLLSWYLTVNLNRYFQLSKHNSELSDLLKQDIHEEENDDEEIAINLNHADPALQFYSKHTAQIEVYLILMCDFREMSEFYY